MYAVYILIVLLLAFASFMFGFSVATDRKKEEIESLQKTLVANDKIREDAINNLKRSHQCREDRMYEDHIKMLDEISRVTGIDTVLLPSFGTVYLNQEKARQAENNIIHGGTLI